MDGYGGSTPWSHTNQHGSSYLLLCCSTVWGAPICRSLPQFARQTHFFICEYFYKIAFIYFFEKCFTDCEHSKHKIKGNKIIKRQKYMVEKHQKIRMGIVLQRGKPDP